MLRHRVAILNQSSVVSDDEVRTIAKALHIQANRDFGPAWGIGAAVSFVPSGNQPPPGLWWLVFLDTSDEANALGYHDLTPEGLPIGKIFAKSDQQYGAKVSVTASHELLEMLGDPFINLVVSGKEPGSFYAYENCDACEADALAYAIEVEGQNVPVSDFVYPRYFDITADNGSVQLDHTHQIAHPFQILPGGYLSKYTPQGGWQQLHGAQPVAGDRPRVGSRRERRRTPRDAWLLSDPVQARAEYAGGTRRPLAALPVDAEDVAPPAVNAAHAPGDGV